MFGLISLSKLLEFEVQLNFFLFFRVFEPMTDYKLSDIETCSAANNGTCLSLKPDQSKAFGDYQYFLSFGGDQYLDIPLAIDAAYGPRGLVSISSTFYPRLFCMKVFLAAFLYMHVSRKKLRKAISYKKFACKILMKLTLDSSNGPFYITSFL
jgi:hypothetical protein